MPTEFSERLRALLSELRRRRVLRAAALYASAAFVVVEASSIIFEALDLGSRPLTVVLVIAIFGFPVALVVAWAFDFSSEGLKRTESRNGAPSQLVQPRDSLTRDLLLVGVVAAASVGVGWVGWKQWLEPVRQPGSEAPAEARAAEDPFDPRRIAVDYFEDFSPEGELSHLARGLTNDLIHELDRLEPLDVVSPHGVKQYRGADVTRDSLFRALEVGSWVEGSVQASNDEIRVTAQLIDTNTGSLLESVAVSRPLGELFELQDDVVHQVVTGLRERLGTVVRRRERQREAPSVEAWSLVRRAEELHDAAKRLEDAEAAVRRLTRADTLLSQAAALDSTWAEPVVLRGRLALTRAELAMPQPTEFDPEWVRRGTEYAEAALERKPDDPRALELRGMARLRLSLSPEAPEEVRRAAERDLRAAVEADSSRARAWNGLSALLRHEGRFTEASRAAERAFKADQYLTLSPSIEGAVLRELYHTSIELNDRDAARSWCTEAHRKFPTQSWTSGCKLFNLVLFERPDLDSAWSLLDSMVEHTPGDTQWNRNIGRLYVAMGIARRARMAGPTDARKPSSASGRGTSERAPLSGELADSARAVVERARKESQGSSELSSWVDYHEAYVRLQLGEHDSAIKLLGRYLEAHPEMGNHLREDWLFEELRSEPRFQRLLEGAP